ncbi:beta strand repeat-containing protein [Arenivirga flava]|uniref:DUF7507 domain-containing protein n=1 Tax=Arenivirga flava TaxID=1930060 RepID=A0AA37XBH9_9MICO|nr:AraC family transcriptional regulator [Arenivirga flava]GMA28798.1 hypothetical protein GCM10025874_20510 [Arenivirga flava]
MFRALAGVLAVAVAVTGLSLAALHEPAEAAVISWGAGNDGATPTYQETVNGDFITVGNGVLGCSGTALGGQSGSGTCNDLHLTTTATGNNVNDYFTMVNANAASGFTTNSSSATLTIPSGATVVKAFLNWSANTGVMDSQPNTFRCTPNTFTGATATMPSGSATGYRTQPVQFRVGTSGTPTSVPVGSVLEDTDSGEVAANTPHYYSAGADITSAFANVTTGSPITVQAGRIWAPTGPNCYAGWNLTLVYDFGGYVQGNTASAPKRVIYYEGHVRQSNGEAPLQVPFQGFTAVETGTARLGYSLFEGDRSIANDYMEYARGNASTYTRLTNPANPSGSTSTTNIGVGRAAGSVRYTQTGTDANFTNQNVDVNTNTLAAVQAGDTSVSLRVGTTGDSFLLRNAVLSVPTGGLVVQKTLLNSTSDVQYRTANEPAQFTIRVRNTGDGNLTNFTVTDDQSNCNATRASLAPGGVWEYTCTAASGSASGYTSTANVTATTGSNYSISASDSTQVVPTAIRLTKTSSLAAGATGRAGDVVNYSFTATNNGGTGSVLTGVTITDPLAGLSALTYGTWPSGTSGTLNPGQSVTATATYTLRQSDVDAGSVPNTASTRGTDPDGGTQPTATANRTQTVAANPALTVTKSGAYPSGQTGVVGNTVNWTIGITNSGNVTVSGITLTDTLAGLSTPVFGTWPSGTAGTLAPGQTVTATASSTIAQADVNRGSVSNTASASGRTPANVAVTGTSPAATVNTVAAAPAIVATKSATVSGTGAVGDTVSYTFSARNSGNVTLTGVAITDQLAGLSALSYGTWPSGTTGTLQPGQTVTATATYTIKQADVNAGAVDNTATASGTAPSGTVVTNAASARAATAAAAPGLVVTKSGALASGATGRAGDGVAYTFTLRNTGNVTLTGVGVRDPLSGLSAITFGTWPSGTAGTLQPGQQVTATATYALKQSDVDAGSVVNTATGTATPPSGTAFSRSSSSTLPITPAGALTLGKSGQITSGNGGVGSTVRYTFTLANTGNVTLTQLAISDPLSGLGAIGYGAWPSGTTGALAPGTQVTGTATYTVTQADVDRGFVQNTASASGRTPQGGTVSGSSPQTRVTTAAAAPAVTVQKTAAVSGSGIAGDVITYTFVARNAGNVTLTGVAVSDPLSGLSALTYGSWPSGTSGTLAPGQQVTATATYTIKQSDVNAGSVRNTASVSGLAPGAATPTTGTSEQVTTSTAAANPAFTVAKSASLAPGSTGRAGDTVNYAFTVRNSGNVTLTGVALSDPLPGLSAIAFGTWPSGTSGTLQPGQQVVATATYTLTQSDVDAGSVANTATGTVTPPSGTAFTRSGSATLPVASSGALVVTKTSALGSGSGNAGSRVDYAFTVRNSGNVTLRGVTLEDKLAGLGAITYGTWPSGTAGTLRPGQTVSATATYTLTQGDVDRGRVVNTASASGNPPSGDAVRSAEAQNTFLTAASAPAVSLTKSAAVAGSGAVGDVIAYTFVVRNTGNVTVSGGAVADPRLGTSSIDFGTWNGTLAPGASVTGTARYAITQTDVDAGQVRNTATFSGTAPGAVPVSASSGEVTTRTAASAPAVALTKTGAVSGSASPRAGDTVTYAFVLRNTGNVTLTSAGISDPLAGLSAIAYGTWTSGTAGTLLPGQQVSASATYTIRQADVDAGGIANTATGRGTAPNAAVSTATASSTVPLAPNAALSVTKTPSTTSGAAVGQTITYDFVIANPGTVTISGITLADSLPGISAPVISWPDADRVLAPGREARATATYVVRQSDVDAGFVRNTASVSGLNPQGGAVGADSNRAQTDTVARSAAIATTKTAELSGSGVVGDTITYTITARNGGNVTLTGVTIADSLPGISSLAYTWPGTPGTLAPGETVNARGTYAITQADVDAGSVRNVATASGQPPTGERVSNASPAATTQLVARTAEFTLAKDGALAPGARGNAGDDIDYTFTLRNTGNVTLTDLVVTDPEFPGLSINAASLAPGATLSGTARYRILLDDVEAGAAVNVASGAATGADGSRIIRTDAQTIRLDPQAAIDLQKRAAYAADQPNAGAAGSTVEYEFTITNIGNVTLNGVQLDDPRIDGPITVVWPDASAPNRLLPGEIATAAASAQVTQEEFDDGEIVNDATVTADGVGGPVSDDASITLLTGEGVPQIAITKSAPATAPAGGPVPFVYTITNTGNVTLTDVRLDDVRAGGDLRYAVWGNAPPTLAPGQSITSSPVDVTPTQDEIDQGFIEGPGTTSGAPAGGGARVEATASARTLLTASPALTVEKTVTAPPGLLRAGQDPSVLTYDFTIRNTGDIRLDGVALVDPLLPADAITYGAWPSGTSGVLLRGQFVTATATYALNQAQVDAGTLSNTATASGSPSDGSAPVSGSGTATQTIAPSSTLAVVKGGSVTSGIGAAGSTITWTFEIRNTGNVTLNALILAESLEGIGTPVFTWPGTPRELAPGQVATGTATYTVTQADVNRGFVDNLATATGTQPNGETTSQTSNTARVELLPGTPAAIGLVKTATLGDAAGRLGDVVSYEYVITNDGPVTLQDVTLTDPQAALSSFAFAWPGAAGTLQPGERAVARASHVVTQADVDAGTIDTTATVTGASARTAPPQSVTASDDAPVALVAPSNGLAVDKVGALRAGATGAPGDVVDYTVTVTNTGQGTLRDVAMTDPNASYTAGTWPSGVVGELAPGQRIVYTGSYPVVQSDIDAGSVTGAARATATAVRGADPAPVTDPETVVLPTNAAIAVTKSGSTRGAVGDAVTWSFTIRNTGNVTLRELTLADSLPGITGLEIRWPGAVGELPVGGAATASASSPVTQADLDAGSVTNTATVRGVPQSGPAVSASSGAVTVPLAAAEPSMRVVKTGDPGRNSGAGDLIRYAFEVENTGNVTLRDVALRDALPGLSPLVLTWPTTEDGVLAPGASLRATAFVVITQAQVDAGSITNTALATATPARGQSLEARSPEVVTPTETQEPSIASTVSGALAAGATGAAGDTVDWRYRLTNTGNVTLTDVTLRADEGAIDPASIAWPGAVGVLAPGASVTATGTSTLTQAQVDAGRVAEELDGTGLPPRGAAVTTTSRTDVAVASRPALAVTKDSELAEAGRGNAGDVVDYSFTVSNTGNVTLTLVDLIERLPGVSDPEITWPDADRPGVLLPGETADATADYTIEQADVDAGTIGNTVIAVGQPPTGARLSVESDRQITTTSPAAPAIEVVKTAPVSGQRVGQVLDYRFAIRNTGNVTLTGVELEDRLAGLGTPVISWPGATGTLAPGQQAVATAGVRVTQAQFDAGAIENTAVVRGTAPDRSTVATDDSAITTPLAASTPSVDLVKTGVLAPGATGRAGDRVEFTLTAVNTGDTTLTDVVVTDPNLGGTLLTIPSLAPQERRSVTASIVLSQASVDSGSYVNTATAAGASARDGSAVGDSAVSTVRLDQAPGLVVTKRGIAQGNAGVGDSIDYAFTIENTGNVTVSGVQLLDSKPGVTAPVIDWSAAAAEGRLAPGQRVTATASYPIAQADVDAGSVRNTATATGTLPSGDPVIGRSPESVVATAQATPSLRVVKGSTVADTNGDGVTGGVGDQVAYTITITNGGNVTVRDVTASDPLPGLSAPVASAWPAATGVLAPRQSVEFRAVYTVQQADVDAGSVRNTATASGTAANGAAVQGASAPNTARLVTARPSIAVTDEGALASGSGVAGDEILWRYSLTNTGNVTLRGVTLIESLATAGEVQYVWPGAEGVLAPGERVTATSLYPISQRDVDSGAVTSIVNGVATPPTGAAVRARAVDTVPLNRVAGLEVTKVGTPAAAGAVAVGDTVDYVFTLSNTGTTTLTGVTLTDPLQGVSSPRIEWPGTPGTIAPGVEVRATASYVIRQADVDAGAVRNVATARGTDPTGATVQVESALSEVPTAAQAPAIAAQKSGAVVAGDGSAGSTVRYDFRVTNAGNVTLRLIDLSDDLPGISRPALEFPATSGYLAPGETALGTATYALTQADVDRGFVDNIATAVGTSPAGARVSADSNTFRLQTAAPAPALQVTQMAGYADGGYGRAGDVIEYTYAVRNSGNVSLDATTLASSLGGLTDVVVSWPAEQGVLAPGAVATATARYTVTNDDVAAAQPIRNTVTAVGQPRVAGAAPVQASSAQSQLPVVAAAPQLTLQKTGTPSGAAVGDTIDYAFRVINSGNVRVAELELRDPRLGSQPIALTTTALDPGASFTVRAPYTVTQADVDAGVIDNTATITGLPQNGASRIISEGRTSLLTAAAAPGLELVKTVEPATDGAIGLGDELVYGFVLRNTGNQNLTNAAIVDALPGLGALRVDRSGADPQGVLPAGAQDGIAPGGVIRATAAYAITQDDVDAGRVTNAAGASATTPAGGSVSASSGQVVIDTEAAAPSIRVTDSGALAQGAPASRATRSSGRTRSPTRATPRCGSSSSATRS